MILKKYLITCLILIITTVTLNAQNIKYIESALVRVNDSLYISKYEVTNAEYREFYNQNKKQELYPDTTTWQLVKNRVMPFEGDYFTNPKYDRYPVVTVHHNQAKQYCDWLTEFYNNSAVKKYKKVKFRLPTEEEWLQAARGAQPKTAWYPWNGNSLRINNVKSMANYMAMENACLKSEMFNAHIDFLCLDEAMKKCFLESVNSYNQTPFGVYNICGNAAEMTANGGMAKGGSWLSSGYYLRLDITANEQLPIPSPMVGFRVFMDVIEQ